MAHLYERIGGLFIFKILNLETARAHYLIGKRKDVMNEKEEYTKS